MLKFVKNQLIPDGQPIEGSKVRGALIAAFAATGGLLYGYDTGTINGVLAMDYVKKTFTDTGEFTSSESSLITSILSAGTFFGAVTAPLTSDTLGRRIGLIFSTLVFSVGVIVQTVGTTQATLIVGRVIAGVGVGTVSAIVPLYQSETAPKWIRGAVVCCYQWAITVGLLLAACANESTKDRDNASSYRIPLGLQLLWAVILGVGMIFLPETPRFYMMKDRRDKAASALSRLRGLPTDNKSLQDELAEIKAVYEYERSFGSTSYFDCFRSGNHQPKRIYTGIVIQALQQLTGINFIFYYGTTFFKNSGIENPFTVTIVTNVVNVIATIPGILAVDTLGRRDLLFWGAVGMSVSEFLVAIIGTAAGEGSDAANKCLIAFSCTFIASFAATWGPLAWVVIGEIYPLRIRAKAVAITTGANWLFNFVIAFVTPYLMGEDYADLKTKVFFIWGACTFLCVGFVYFFIYETKGLSLEQVDELYDTVRSARLSRKFVPAAGYAQEQRDRVASKAEADAVEVV